MVHEPIINELIKKYETNFKGVGQPLRVALTGSKFGPGLYDIVISLGKESKNSLYDENKASFEESGGFSNQDMQDYIKENILKFDR